MKLFFKAPTGAFFYNSKKELSIKRVLVFTSIFLPFDKIVFN